MIKLTYFNIRGRAEIIRLILEETETPYIDEFVELEQWAALKPTLPLQQLPVYTYMDEEGHNLLFQSHAIYRHLARKHNLYGKNETEHTRCDIVEETCKDIRTALFGLFWNPEFDALRKQFESEQLPVFIQQLERLLQRNSESDLCFVGNQLTYVDFIVWALLDCIRPLSPASLDQSSLLTAFKSHFAKRPRINAYLQSERRPKTITVPRAFFGCTVETS
ncbi:MAG: glutathione S-transferase family protein [Cellvibrionaceae bacterium]